MEATSSERTGSQTPGNRAQSSDSRNKKRSGSEHLRRGSGGSGSCGELLTVMQHAQWRIASMAKLLGIAALVALVPTFFRHHQPLNPAFTGLAQGGKGPSLSVDRTVPKEMAQLCKDRYNVLPGDTMQDLVANWEDRLLPLNRADLQALRSKKYFIASLQRDVGPIFGAWQRELLKVIYVLANEDVSNIFVSLYESHSSDVTQIQLIGLDTLLEALHIPHMVVLGQGDGGHTDRESLSRIEFLARLRNIALQPLFDSDEEYDTVLYLNDVLFCAMDAVDLVRAVDSRSGINADMSCAVDYILREEGQEEQDQIRLYDTWVAHDILGMNMVNDHPYMCHAESQESFDRGEPLEVFSCWNGMIATDADVFQELKVRFRSAHNFECQLSECELMGRDLRVLNRGKLVMLPTARTAYHWEVFRQVAQPDNPGLGDKVALSRPPQPEPLDAMCCSIDRRKNIVLLETCLVQRNWRLGYELFGVPTARSPRDLDADMTHVPTGKGPLFPLRSDIGAVAAADASLKAIAAIVEALAPERKAMDPLIPRRVIMWGSDVENWADDAQVLMGLSSLSFMGGNPGYEFRVVSDTELDTWAANRPGAAEWMETVGHAYRNTLLKRGFDRLLYMHAHGGIYVPVASWAGKPFDEVITPLDELVLAVATNHTNNERQQLFVAAAPKSPVLAAVLEKAREAVLSPQDVYQRIWSNMGEEGRSLEELESHYFTGIEMIRDVVMGHAFVPGVRVLQYDQAAVMFDVARPEIICSGLKHRGQMRQILRQREQITKDYAQAQNGWATTGGGAADKVVRSDLTPVYFDPEVPFRVIFSGKLREDQRLGVRRSISTDSLYRHRQLMQGQYLQPVNPERRTFQAVWRSPPTEGCAAGVEGGRCFLWLSPEGELGIWNGIGLVDPNARRLKLIASPKNLGGSRQPVKLSFTWLVLQEDGNIVLYGVSVPEGSAVGTLVPIWGAGTKFPEDCRAKSACRAYGYLALNGDGSLSLHRGVSPAMHAYLDVGVRAHTRLRECLYHNNFTRAPDFGPPPPPNNEVCHLPHLLKLVTFPNSGTSFTLEATMQATRATVYTSYEAEVNGTRENTPELQELCGKHACRDFGLCQLGRGTSGARLPDWSKGTLLKTHVTRYRAGIYCGPNGLSAYSKALGEGAFEKDLAEYGFLRLYRNPFDNMVARFHLLAIEGRLAGLAYNKGGFLHEDGLFPKRDIYTFLYWHLGMNLLFQQSGRPTAMMTYEALYHDPVGFLRQVVDMLGYSEQEVPTSRLVDVSKSVMGRDLHYYDGEAVPVYIDDFYEPDVVISLANAIHEVIDRTACLSKPIFTEPKVGPIPFGDMPANRLGQQVARRKRRR